MFFDYRRKKNDICSIWELDKNQITNNILEIILIEVKTITDMSYMFSDCGSLFDLQDISKWDTKNVTNIIACFLLSNH